MANTSAPGDPRVALVHDFLLDLRGAERVFLQLCELFPDADLFTAVYDPARDRGALRPPPRPHLAPAAPAADGPHVPPAAAALPRRDGVARPARLRPRRLELVGLGARRDPGARRRPPLLLPQPVPLRLERARGHARAGQRRCCGRCWRTSSAAGASGTTSPPSASTPTSRTRRRRALRIERYLGREATVLHPPVEVERFPRSRARPSPTTTSCSPSSCRTSASTSRCARSRASGCRWSSSATARTRGACSASPGRRCGSPGRVSDAEVAALLRRSRALVVTATEEFGIAAVEAQAAGRPGHRAARRRRARDRGRGPHGRRSSTRRTPESLVAAVQRFDPLAIDPDGLRGERAPVRGQPLSSALPHDRRPGAGRRARRGSGCARATAPARTRARAARVSAAAAAAASGATTRQGGRAVRSRCRWRCS